MSQRGIYILGYLWAAFGLGQMAYDTYVECKSTKKLNDIEIILKEPNKRKASGDV